MNSQQTYEQLIAEIREISLLESVASVLNWDEQTMLPHGGAEHRGNQVAMLAGMAHKRLTAPQIGDWLGALTGSELVKDTHADSGANVREISRNYERQRKLPASLVEAQAKTAVLAQHAWAEARTKSDYAAFQPWLSKTLELKREEAKCVGYKDNPYDALLDPYEPAETSANVQAIFDSFRPRLVGLVGKIAQSSKKAPAEILHRKFSIAAQEKLGREAATAMGFDFESGRLDVSVHPFCSGLGPGDTRMTTRFDENFFGNAFFSVMHETGHALYEQGLPKHAQFGTPLGESISLGIHESQSRMWENLVGRSASFWKHFMPRARAAFPDALKGVADDQWLFAINAVHPSFIRTESDEVTYNLHIMLRFELEQAMVRDEVKVQDIPAAWNERMKKYLGITPPNDREGCLQDIHWSGGMIGYFPTYSLGNLYAAQFFEQAGKDLGDLDAMFAKGEFQPLLGWLRKNIHAHGKRYTAGELVKKVTGKPLSAEPLLRHLSKKAADLYGI
jgi:carboxypeptidase Taq